MYGLELDDLVDGLEGVALLFLDDLLHHVEHAVDGCFFEFVESFWLPETLLGGH